MNALELITATVEPGSVPDWRNTLIRLLDLNREHVKLYDNTYTWAASTPGALAEIQKHAGQPVRMWWCGNRGEVPHSHSVEHEFFYTPAGIMYRCHTGRTGHTSREQFGWDFSREGLRKLAAAARPGFGRSSVTATVEPNSDLVPRLKRVFPGLTLVKSTPSAKLFSTSVSLTVVLYLRPDSASRVVLAYAGHQPPTHGTILCSASDTELPEFLRDMAVVLRRISGFRHHGDPDCLSKCQALVAKYEGHERSTRRVLRALMAQQS